MRDQTTDGTAAPAEGKVVHESAIDAVAGFGGGRAGRVIFSIAVIFSVFQLYTAAFSPLPSIVVRSVHVGFLCLMTFCFAFQMAKTPGGKLLAVLLAIAGFGLSLYHWIFYNDLIVRSGNPSTADIVVGIAVIALLFFAAYRVMGLALPLICAIFLTYALFGQHLPYPLDHRGFDFAQVIDHLFGGTEGIYGVPTYVSSSYIFLFILFGSFLERAGMIQLFTDVAMGTVGHKRGGPGKVAVVASALMGTINGSGVANVVTTGQFTIPLMKKFGFKPAFAGAVEATASMGGQIMPPVMGAVAFIMAENLAVDYVDIVQAAIVPAILYFVTAFWMVHLEAGRLKLEGLPKEQCPSALKSLRANWHLILPLLALIYLLFTGYTPLFAGTVGLALTAVLILGAAATAPIGALALRVGAWVLIGLACGAFLQFGIAVVLGLIALLVAINAFYKGGRETLRGCLDALAYGAKNAIGVGIACAIVGIIIGAMTLTGLASNFARVIVSVGEGSLFLSLVLTMLACLVLGMGIPTIPNYIITASLAAPALLQLGVPLIVSHMFVFYFGIMADLTPPVALAAFAASSIAKESGLKIGLNCMRIAIAGFVVPFMAVYAPALMLQDGGPMAEEIGYVGAVAYVVLKALVAIGLWGAASIGFLLAPMSWPERVIAAAAAFLLVVALPITDQAGFVLAALIFAYHWRRTRPLRAATA
ncbi:MAG TPA: TRAP transporter permease [Alphaproteobacteria bacterium]|nr:TRAP transporter permease [Alphaproteobacteria bacterium]